MSLLWRSHGGPSVAELDGLGLTAADIIDFSVSTNPYGPTASILEAIRTAPLAPYPDSACTVARRRLASHLALPPARIALGNGAADLLWALARTLLRANSTVILVEPTFCEFRAAARAVGATVVEWRARPEEDFAINLAAIDDLARTCRADVVYLCTPNVPTGAALAAREVSAFAAGLPDVRVVLDQSFLQLSERFEDLTVPLPNNVACVRSLTKEHAIPGVRVGYVIATEDMLERLEQQRPAWSTSAPAQAAAIASCDAASFVAHSRARLLEDRARLASALARLGLPPVPSTANFLVAHVGDAARLRRDLLANHRILVRDCASFGLPEHIRVSARPEADCRRLVQAIAEEMRP